MMIMGRILITNDDGIEADGLLRLVKEAMKYGEVWVVAPDGQRSASSHCINLHDSMEIHPYRYPLEGVTAYSCSGMPSDCIRVGIRYLMKEEPMAVLSGINKGYNSATDIQYSGTCGAAFEGAFQGCHSIAFSEGFDGNHEVTDHYLPELLEELLKKPLGYGQIHNVNFPGCSLSDCRGVLRDRTVSHSMFFRDGYRALEQLENGGTRIMVQGVKNLECEEGTDMRAIVENYVSVGIATNIS